MATHAELAHAKYGQSIWYDNVHRGELDSGTFSRLVALGVRGCTSNPTIFEKAMGSTTAYDESLLVLARQGASTEQIYHALVVDDIQRAADVLSPVYHASSQRDGYVCVEVQPRFAGSVRDTVAEAKQLVELIARPNLMIKVPAVDAGFEAITQLLALGISVNVTLIFGLEQYQKVLGSFFAGLEAALEAGRDLKPIASVASFFVSRVDKKVDDLLLAASADPQTALRTEPLLGAIGVANASHAYQHAKRVFAQPRFAALRAAGAQAQRLLWASTGSKSPYHSDTHYADALLGADTVNTLPPATLDAFLDHGALTPTLDVRAEHYEALLQELDARGIRLARLCDELVSEGMRAFAASMDGLMTRIATRRDEVAAKFATSGQ